MADPWPASLPQCFVVGFNEGLADGRISYAPDQGPAIMRRRSSAGVRPLSGQMRMSRAQIADLKTFVDTTLLAGSLPFTFKDPTSQDTVLVRFPDQKLPAWQEIKGGVFRVSLDMEILP